MNQYYGLLHAIAKEFHIKQGKTESDEQWKARTIYSLLGRMAYASLMDHWEEQDDAPECSEIVSVIHFKQRIRTILSCYLELYPEIHPCFADETGTLCDEIYDIFLKSGCIYHTPYRICSAAPCCARHGNLRFERGMPLNRKQYISGLGAYLPASTTECMGKVYSSIREMFGLQADTLSEAWQAWTDAADWRPLPATEEMEYLFHGSFAKQWKNTPEKDDVISVARLGGPEGYLYYLYQIKNGQLMGSQLPNWQVNDSFYEKKAYLCVTNACLNSLSRLPAIKFRADGPVVYIHFGYLPPPAELYWLKLYSWPVSFNRFPSDFRRVFCRDVFHAIKEVMEQSGYQFAEE